MYIHFRYKNGSNPYISFRNDNLFKMICKYNMWEESENMFYITEERNKEKDLTPWQRNKKALQDFAMMWLDCFCDCRYSWEHLAEWGAFFEEYGKKYGLLREFRENGII